MRTICIMVAIMKRAFFVILLSAVLMAAGGCSAGTLADTNGKGALTVAVTIVPEKTFVEAVGKDLVDVVLMVPPGSSPESYEPTAAQMQEFSKASLYFAIGVPVEEAGILDRAGEGTKIVRLQDEVALKTPDRELAPGRRDPHIWLSPRRVMTMVSAIARELGRADPAHRDAYEANAKNYIEELEALNRRIGTILARAKHKTFIVFHPAFGYLADDYGLTMAALEKEGKEATPHHLREMIDLARSKGIRTVFFQDEVDSRQSEAFAEEIMGQTVRLDPLAADYADNLERMAGLIAEGAK
jgi:zinc transport system substrate-binding protein